MKEDAVKTGIKIAIHVAVGAAVMVLLLLIFAAFTSKGTLPQDMVPALSLTAVAVGAVLAGLLTAIRCRSHLLPLGLAAGGGYFVLLALLGSCLYFSSWLTGDVLWVLALSVGGGAAGALMKLLFAGKKRRR